MKKNNKRTSLFYFENIPNSKKIKAVGIGKNNGEITLTKKNWKIFIISLLPQI
jgi:hypothetical protein